MNWARLKKYSSLLGRPKLYPALRQGVAPGVEHLPVVRLISPATLLDIGANKGQFSAIVRFADPSTKIYAFEPLAGERAKFAAAVPGAEMFPVAIGENPGTANFHLTNRADSSSLFAPSGKAKSAYGVATETIIEVSVARVQDLLPLERLAAPVLMKIDVQGAELSVLRSLGSDLRHIDFIYCEVSFAEIYEDQPMASEVIAFLYGQGFHLRGVYNLSDTKAFGLTQADLLFERVASGIVASTSPRG